MRRTVEPTQEPVSLDEVKSSLRLDSTDSDDLITALIVAAREACESYTRRAFCLQTWQLTLDSFPPYGCPCDVWSGAWPARLELPRPPLISLASIVYADGEGESQTMDAADYRVGGQSEPARLQPVTSWPGTMDQIEAVAITYTAGYLPGENGSPTDYAANVPMSIKQAVKFAVKAWFWECEGVAQSELPQVSMALLNPYRVHVL